MKYLKRRAKKPVSTRYVSILHHNPYNDDTRCCGTCEHFSMSMVCYGGSPFEVCRCLRGSYPDVYPDHEACCEYSQLSTSI